LLRSFEPSDPDHHHQTLLESEPRQKSNIVFGAIPGAGTTWLPAGRRSTRDRGARLPDDAAMDAYVRTFFVRLPERGCGEV
jgi:hypothetical protein